MDPLASQARVTPLSGEVFWGELEGLQCEFFSVAERASYSDWILTLLSSEEARSASLNRWPLGGGAIGKLIKKRQSRNTTSFSEIGPPEYLTTQCVQVEFIKV
jgi:hypothetical protein